MAPCLVVPILLVLVTAAPVARASAPEAPASLNLTYVRVALPAAGDAWSYVPDAAPPNGLTDGGQGTDPRTTIDSNGDFCFIYEDYGADTSNGHISVKRFLAASGTWEQVGNRGLRPLVPTFSFYTSQGQSWSGGSFDQWRLHGLSSGGRLVAVASGFGGYNSGNDGAFAASTAFDANGKQTSWHGAHGFLWDGVEWSLLGEQGEVSSEVNLENPGIQDSGTYRQLPSRVQNIKTDVSPQEKVFVMMWWPYTQYPSYTGSDVCKIALWKIGDSTSWAHKDCPGEVEDTRVDAKQDWFDIAAHPHSGALSVLRRCPVSEGDDKFCVYSESMETALATPKWDRLGGSGGYLIILNNAFTIAHSASETEMRPYVAFKQPNADGNMIVIQRWNGDSWTMLSHPPELQGSFGFLLNPLNNLPLVTIKNSFTNDKFTVMEFFMATDSWRRVGQAHSFGGNYIRNGLQINPNTGSAILAFGFSGGSNGLTAIGIGDMVTSGAVSSSQPSASWKLPPATPGYLYTGFKLEATQVADQQSGWMVIQEKSMGEATEQSGWAAVEFSIASVTSKLGAFDSTKSVSIRVTLKNDAFGFGVPGAPARICLGESTVALGSACLASSDQCPEGRKPSRAGASSCVPGPCPAGRFGQAETTACTSCPVGRFAGERGFRSHCEICPEGEKQEGTGSTSCDVDPLYECWKAGMCKSCTERASNGTYFQCPPGQVLAWPSGDSASYETYCNTSGCSADICCEMAPAHDLAASKVEGIEALVEIQFDVLKGSTADLYKIESRAHGDESWTDVVVESTETPPSTVSYLHSSRFLREIASGYHLGGVVASFLDSSSKASLDRVAEPDKGWLIEPLMACNALGDESWCTETGVSWGSGAAETVTSGTAEECTAMCADPENDCKIYAWSPPSTCRLRQTGPYRREGPGDHPMMCTASDGSHVAGLAGWVSGAADCAAWCTEGYEEPVSSTCRAADGFTSGEYVRLLSVAHGEYLAAGASGDPPSFVDPATVTTRPVAAALPVFQMVFDEAGRPGANSKPWVLGGVRFKATPGSSHAGMCWMNTVSSSMVWSGCDQTDAEWTLTQFDRSDGLTQGTAKLGGQMYRVSLRNGVDASFGKPVAATVCPQGGEKCHDCDMRKDCEICTFDDASGGGRWGRRTCPANRACRSGHARVLVGANVLPYHSPGTPHPADTQSCNYFSRCLHQDCSP